MSEFTESSKIPLNYITQKTKYFQNHNEVIWLWNQTDYRLVLRSSILVLFQTNKIELNQNTSDYTRNRNPFLFATVPL